MNKKNVYENVYMLYEKLSANMRKVILIFKIIIEQTSKNIFHGYTYKNIWMAFMVL